MPLYFLQVKAFEKYIGRIPYVAFVSRELGLLLCSSGSMLRYGWLYPSQRFFFFFQMGGMSFPMLFAIPVIYADALSHREEKDASKYLDILRSASDVLNKFDHPAAEICGVSHDDTGCQMRPRVLTSSVAVLKCCRLWYRISETIIYPIHLAESQLTMLG